MPKEVPRKQIMAPATDSWAEELSRTLSASALPWSLYRTPMINLTTKNHTDTQEEISTKHPPDLATLLGPTAGQGSDTL